MAEPSFDRARFSARLATRRLGRALVVRAATGSTNDDAWAALAELGDGAAVVADVQTRGRGRAGRTWTHASGQGLALSVGLRLGCDLRQAGLVPLAAGVAIARAVARFGVPARLKWPNDVLVGGRKLAGVLCELRRTADGGDAVVIGVGANVRQRASDFPPELSTHATSLALAGADAAPEELAAGFLNALEPLWTELQEGDRGAIPRAWTSLAAFWGEPVTVATPAGVVSGVAQRLDDDGALVLRLESGVETAVIAGDVAPDGAATP